jgi:hypothetical protein
MWLQWPREMPHVSEDGGRVNTGSAAGVPCASAQRSAFHVVDTSDRIAYASGQYRGWIALGGAPQRSFPLMC